MDFKLLFEKLLITNNNLCENSNLIELKYENKEEIEDWLIDYERFNNFCETNKYNPLKIYYFNKNYIHKILYDKQELILLNSNKSKNNLPYYFYLSLLIKDNPDIVNYSYSFEFIKEIYSNINNDNNDKNKYKI